MKSCYARWNPSKLGWNLQPAASDEITSVPPLPAKRDFITKWFHPTLVGFIPSARTDLTEKSTCLRKCFFLAERWGFEPQNGSPPLRDFQSRAFDQLSHLSVPRSRESIPQKKDFVNTYFSFFQINSADSKRKSRRWFWAFTLTAKDVHDIMMQKAVNLLVLHIESYSRSLQHHSLYVFPWRYLRFSASFKNEQNIYQKKPKRISELLAI